MQPPILSTFRPGMSLAGNVFYILNKGMNAGRPLSQPCPNCYAAICRTEAAKDYWVAVCEMLLVTKRFQRELVGSVIPFIRIGELRSLIREFAELDNSLMNQTTKQINMLDELEMNLHYQLANVGKAKLALAANALRLL